MSVSTPPVFPPDNERIVVLYAHSGVPPSRVNRRLAAAVAGVPGVRLHDLYETYPDFHIDVPREQALLAQAELVVLQYPVHWYSVPSLLKEWFDVVLEHGWAYGPGGNALAGKDVWVVATTGGGIDGYQPSGTHGYPFEAFLPPVKQTMTLCGMHWLPPLVLHDAHHAGDEALAAHAARYRDRLASYPAWRS